MLRTKSSRAVTGLCTLAIAAAVASPASASEVSSASLQSDVQQLVGDITQDSQLIADDAVVIAQPTLLRVQSTVAALRRDVSSIARRTTTSALRTTDSTARRTTNSALRTTDSTVKSVRRLGARAFVAVDRTGRTAVGPSTVSVIHPVTGVWDIYWGLDLGGCAQVAMANNRTSDLLRVEQTSPFSVRVLQRSTTADLSGAGFVLAAFC
jgi:hypothetical protein